MLQKNAYRQAFFTFYHSIGLYYSRFISNQVGITHLHLGNACATKWTQFWLIKQLLIFKSRFLDQFYVENITKSCKYLADLISLCYNELIGTIITCFCKANHLINDFLPFFVYFCTKMPTGRHFSTFFKTQFTVTCLPHQLKVFFYNYGVSLNF